LKLIDLGASTRLDIEFDTMIQSQFYRAPEVFIGKKFDLKIDVWGFGCLLLEMLLGVPVFYGRNDLQMFQLFEIRCGPFPIIMSIYSDNFFKEDGSVKRSIEDDNQLREYGIALIDNRDLITLAIDEELNLISDNQKKNYLTNKRDLFIDLIVNMMKLDPSHRYSMAQVQQHPFLVNNFDQVN
jgi:serine/threonine protein kinase